MLKITTKTPKVMKLKMSNKLKIIVKARVEIPIISVRVPNIDNLNLIRLMLSGIL